MSCVLEVFSWWIQMVILRTRSVHEKFLWYSSSRFLPHCKEGDAVVGIPCQFFVAFLSSVLRFRIQKGS